jgi:uncharacterized protein (DUF58 family)
MTRLDSPRIVSYAGLAAFGLIAGLVVGRVELVALAAPFALAAVVGAALVRDPQLSAAIVLDRDRALEGEDVHVSVELSAPIGADRVEVFLPLPAELRVPEGNPRAVSLVGERTLDVVVQCERWGAFAIGPEGVPAAVAGAGCAHRHTPRARSPRPATAPGRHGRRCGGCAG